MYNRILARDGRENAPRLPTLVQRVVYEHVYASSDREVGGVLMGYRRADGRSMGVTGAIPALRASEARSSVTFTHETWQAIHRELNRHDGQTIVGWYHSQPALGLFMSDQDRFIHQHFFSDPHQVALVIDPAADREKWFGWRGDEIAELTRDIPTGRRLHQDGFWAHDAADEPGARTQVWLERAGYAFAGVVAGVALWAAVGRNGTIHRASPSARDRPSSVRQAHPIVVEPQTGAHANFGGAGQASGGGNP